MTHSELVAAYIIAEKSLKAAKKQHATLAAKIRKIAANKDNGTIEGENDNIQVFATVATEAVKWQKIAEAVGYSVSLKTAHTTKGTRLGKIKIIEGV